VFRELRKLNEIWDMTTFKYYSPVQEGSDEYDLIKYASNKKFPCKLQLLLSTKQPPGVAENRWQRSM